jgi:hypothetical protein
MTPVKKASANFGQSLKSGIRTDGYGRGNTQAEDQDRKQQHPTAYSCQTHQGSHQHADHDFQEK